MPTDTLESALGKAALDWFAAHKDQVLAPGFEDSPADQEMPGAPEGSGQDVALDVGQQDAAIPAQQVDAPPVEAAAESPIAYKKKPKPMMGKAKGKG